MILSPPPLGIIKAREKDRMPTRPIYMRAMITRQLPGDRVPVRPVLSPTVPRAEITS